MNLKFPLLGIRGIQVLLVFLVIILEIVQAADFASYYNSLTTYGSGGTSEYFTGSTYGKAGTVVWVFIVMLITFLALVAYLALFFIGPVWNMRQKIYFVGFDLLFIVLWITEVFTNLYWAYKGNQSFCYYYTSNKNLFDREANVISEQYGVSASDPDTICGAYIASNVFGWFLLLTFILGAALSFKIHLDSKKENTGTNTNMQQQPGQQQFSQQQFNQQFNPQQQLNPQQQFKQTPQQFNQQPQQPQQFNQQPQQFNQQSQQFNQQPQFNQQYNQQDTNTEVVEP